MSRWLSLTALAVLVLAAPANAAGLKGQYIEARTCDVWTAPCFANAEINLTGKNAVIGWKVDKGTFDNVTLDGLSIVAVVAATDTLGIKQTGPSKTVLIVDKKANAKQREALIRMAKKQGGELVENVIAIESEKIDLNLSQCKEGGCATLDAGNAKIETRCLDKKHDKACGNESAFYTPLTKGVTASAAVTVEHTYTGQEFNATWKDPGRRGAYVGSFEIQ
jgi:hypothetical protein